MNVSEAKIFIVGAVLGAIVGAAFLGPIVHLVLIAVVVAGVGLALTADADSSCAGRKTRSS
jgi:hypothetical protein